MDRSYKRPQEEKMKKIFKKISKTLRHARERYQRNKELKNIRNIGEYTLYEYKDKKGEFEYQRYIDAQIDANKKKIDCVWVQKENIDFISDYIKNHIGSVDFGLCHGTRRGVEQGWFIENLGCEVIGTEISDTAKDFPHTIQWDFHKAKPEWINSVDFIYSNSLDHSYDPESCMNTWISCLKDNGILIIEHSSDDIDSKVSDPFGAHLHIMPYLFLKWGKGKYSAREMIKAPAKSKFRNKSHDTYLFFIKKNI